MRIAMLIGAATCSVAAADEIISTIGLDWNLAYGWTAIGQTMTVPESNMLETFVFLGQEWHDGDAAYTITIYDWDEDGQHVVGAPRYWAEGQLPSLGPGYLGHDTNVLLKRGSKVAVVIEFELGVELEGGLGYVEGHHYEGGGFISTQSPIDGPWTYTENHPYELTFAATFRSCPADVYNDGSLNIFDYLAFQTLFTNGDMQADFNHDGMLDVLDFVAFQGAFLEGC